MTELVEFILSLPLIVLLAIVAAIVVIVAARRRSASKPQTSATMRKASGEGATMAAVDMGWSAPEREETGNRDRGPVVPWKDQIEAAEAREDIAALPALFLAHGREEIANGNTEAGGDHLRSCIRWAAKTKNPALEAEARVELAELARAAEDLTTACEHWQIARALFHKLARESDLAATEEAMRAHGCPTDWVLTDF